MNITIDKFNSRIIARICEAGIVGDLLQTIRFSLLFANDGHGHKVDLAKLATFPDADFWHDVIEINQHASRDHENCGVLQNCFVPRCGFVKEVA